MPAIVVAVSFICTILCAIPFPWHYRTGNIPTMMNMIWIGQGNLFRGISAIIWNGSVERKALVYCDIALQLQIASVWGMSASALCITRHLESVSSPRYSSSGLNDPRNRKMFEIFMCIIAPFIFAAVHLIVQGHRFDLIEDVGCSPTTYWSWASIFLFFLPPVCLGIANSFYAVLALRWFIQRRAQFHDLLNASGYTASRYIRLMGLALAELVGIITCNLVVLGLNAEVPLRPWISWDNVHSDFKRVDQYPLSVMTQHNRDVLWGVWALYPISAVLFFAFFGFGQEAITEYKKTYQWIRVHIFRGPPLPNQNSRGNVSLPSFVASGSMASRSKAQLSSAGQSMTVSRKYDPTLDFDDDSLYDADERRGQRSVTLNDLESSGTDYSSVDEKSLAASRSLTPAPAPAPQLPQLPMPTLSIPQTPHHLSLSQTSSSADEESAPGTPRAL
jgi:pheromone a factor receptor